MADTIAASTSTTIATSSSSSSSSASALIAPLVAAAASVASTAADDVPLPSPSSRRAEKRPNDFVAPTINGTVPVPPIPIAFDGASGSSTISTVEPPTTVELPPPPLLLPPPAPPEVVDREVPSSSRTTTANGIRGRVAPPDRKRPCLQLVATRSREEVQENLGNLLRLGSAREYTSKVKSLEVLHHKMVHCLGMSTNGIVGLLNKPGPSKQDLTTLDDLLSTHAELVFGLRDLADELHGTVVENAIEELRAVGARLPPGCTPPPVEEPVEKPTVVRGRGKKDAAKDKEATTSTMRVPMTREERRGVKEESMEPSQFAHLKAASVARGERGASKAGTPARFTKVGTPSLEELETPPLSTASSRSAKLRGRLLGGNHATPATLAPPCPVATTPTTSRERTGDVEDRDSSEVKNRPKRETSHNSQQKKRSSQRLTPAGGSSSTIASTGSGSGRRERSAANAAAKAAAIAAAAAEKVAAAATETNGGDTAAPDEPTYCHCNRVSFGEMVGCDNPKCEFEWFHFECVDLKRKPTGKWYCPDCRHPDTFRLPKTAVINSKGSRKEDRD